MNNENIVCTSNNYTYYLESLDIFSGLDPEFVSNLIESTEWVEVPEETFICREGDASDAMYFLVQGTLRVLVQHASGTNRLVATLSPGDMVGEISLIAGVVRTASIQAAEPASLIRLPREAFERLSRQEPGIIDKIGDLARRRLKRDQLLNVLPAFVSSLDEKTLSEVEAQLEWIELQRGQILFRQGEPSDSIYLLVTGRLRAYLETKFGEQKVLSDIAQGEIIGEMGFFTQESRSASICALRNSTVVRIDRRLFGFLIKNYPDVMMAIVRRLISRLQSTHQEKPYRCSLTMAVVPAQSDVPITQFCQQFADALAKYGTTFHLNSTRFDHLTGIERGTEKLAPSDPYSIRLNTWIDEHEKTNNFVLYEADYESSTWSMRCLQQADVVIIVANAKGEKSLGRLAREIAADKSDIVTVRQTLVLLHDESELAPVETSEWLALASVDRHAHIRLGRKADLERLARIVSGRAVGLVLGGGGARGFAHIGVIRALEEAGIPIDMIGGTSMGAIISAQYAEGWHYDEMLEWNRKTFIEIKPHKDFTLPIISLTRGIKGKKVAKMLYGDKLIEDLWIDFFSISSSLSRATAIVHDKGLLRKATSASAALPGITVPIIDKGSVLIDGGLINNLPCDIMKKKCGGDVIAVDVGSQLHLQIEDEEVPSPWKVVASRILPFQKPIKTITIFDVLLGATFVGGDSRLDQLKSAADYYLRPPIESYSMLQMEALDAIAETAYEYAIKEIATWEKEGRLGQQ